MSLTGKTIANSYKDLLQVDNSNSGVDTTIRNVKDGEGTASALSISDDVVTITPQTDNTTGTFIVADQGTSNILLSVDSTNGAVKGPNAKYINTQYQYFSIARPITSAGQHQSMPIGANTGTRAGADLGTGTNPATTYDLSADTSYPEYAVYTYWRVPDAITIDSVTVLASAFGTGTGTDVHFHLMSYDMSTSAGSLGDLSNGNVLFNSSADIEDVVETEIHLQTLSSVDTRVAAGKIILATFEESNSAGANAQAIMTVKYHLT